MTDATSQTGLIAECLQHFVDEFTASRLEFLPLLDAPQLAHRSPKTLLTRLQPEHPSKGFLYHHNHPLSQSRNLNLANFCLLRSRLEQATPQRCLFSDLWKRPLWTSSPDSGDASPPSSNELRPSSGA